MPKVLMRALVVTAVVVALSAVTACAPASPPAPTTTPPTTVAPPPDPIAGLTLEQRVGQLFMVGTPAATVGPDAMAALQQRHVGAIFLSGRSAAGTAATAAVVAQFTAAATPAVTAGVPLFIATDQEGGKVQVLSGPGFSSIPSAQSQGTMDPAALQSSATTWGAELASAGVNLDLAPVADITSGPDSANPPIAELQREYGYDPATVDSHAGAFIAGMTSSGVVTTIKHFPGLGYVTANTDDTAGVTDTVTSADGPTVASFGTLIDGGAPVVMVSSAIYSLIDPAAPAVFSPTVVGLLRNQLAFKGIIVSDDLSGATQVQSWSPENRAVLAIRAGVDIVLVTRTPTLAAQMIDAVVAQAKADPAFAELVDDAARVVVTQKAALGIH